MREVFFFITISALLMGGITLRGFWYGWKPLVIVIINTLVVVVLGILYFAM